jgi:hypothetical protein
MRFQTNNILLAFLASALCACSTISVNKSSAELMPKDVALKILRQHIGINWLNHPQVKQPPLCGGDFVSIDFSDIDSAEYLQLKNTFQFKSSKFKKLICASPRAQFGPMPKESAEELVKAAIALGAKLDKLEVEY